MDNFSTTFNTMSFQSLVIYSVKYFSAIVNISVLNLAKVPYDLFCVKVLRFPWGHVRCLAYTSLRKRRWSCIKKYMYWMEWESLVLSLLSVRQAVRKTCDAINGEDCIPLIMDNLKFMESPWDDEIDIYRQMSKFEKTQKNFTRFIRVSGCIIHLSLSSFIKGLK